MVLQRSLGAGLWLNNETHQCEKASSVGVSNLLPALSSECDEHMMSTICGYMMVRTWLSAAPFTLAPSRITAITFLSGRRRSVERVVMISRASCSPVRLLERTWKRPRNCLTSNSGLMKRMRTAKASPCRVLPSKIVDTNSASFSSLPILSFSVSSTNGMYCARWVESVKPKLLFSISGRRSFTFARGTPARRKVVTVWICCTVTSSDTAAVSPVPIKIYTLRFR